MKRTRVFKFGGSSFRQFSAYSIVADLTISRLETDSENVVVVVSAMYGHTDRLLDAGLSISSKLSGEAADALATTGEMMSASLLRIAFEHRGIPATMLNGFQLGIASNSNFTRAKIRSVDPRPLEIALESNRAVVVTGAQAVDSTGRLTMLGRNSSDLTAIALAAGLGLSECEIFSDVPGVYTADPHSFSNAQLLPMISHQQLVEISRSGAKVIHYGAAGYAAQHGVQIICRATANAQKAGTIVRHDAPFHNLVVVNDKSTLVQFESIPEAEAAELDLISQGVDVLWVQRSTGAILSFTPGVKDDVAFMMRNHPQACILRDRGIVSMVRDTGTTERIVAPISELPALAARWHDKFYERGSGVSVDGRLTSPSSYTSLLTNSSDSLTSSL